MKKFAMAFYVVILCIFFVACINDNVPKNVFYKTTGNRTVMVAVGMSRTEAEGILGKPEKEQVGYIYPGESEYFYDNNAISVVYVEDIARYIFLNEKADWSIWGGVKPGVLLSDVEKVFGAPLNRYDGVALYWVNDSHEIITDDKTDRDTNYTISFSYNFEDDTVIGIHIFKF